MSAVPKVFHSLGGGGCPCSTFFTEQYTASLSFTVTEDKESTRPRLGSGGAVKFKESASNSREKIAAVEILSLPHMSFTKTCSIAWKCQHKKQYWQCHSFSEIISNYKAVTQGAGGGGGVGWSPCFLLYYAVQQLEVVNYLATFGQLQTYIHYLIFQRPCNMYM